MAPKLLRLISYPEVFIVNLQTGLALVMSALLVPLPVFSQSAGKIKVVVLEGEGALNNIKQRSATQPRVKVVDDGDRPVAGAEVVFHLPAAGPGGVFNGWMRTATVRSDAQGEAAATGMTPNDEEGRFNIKVTASEGSR